MNSEMQYRDERVPRADSNHGLSWSWTSFQAQERNEDIKNKPYAPHDMYVMYAELSEPRHHHASMHTCIRANSFLPGRCSACKLYLWSMGAPVSTAILSGTRLMDIICESDQQLAHFWASGGNGARGGKTDFLLPCLGSRRGSGPRRSLQTTNVNAYDQHTWATPLSVIGLLASPVSSAASVDLENV